MKILMVCLGNICRSPLAEGILRHKLEYEHLDIVVDSAGTGGWHVGEAPHKLSQQTANRHNINISHLRGRKFCANDMSAFDRIYVMDSENYNNVKYIAGTYWDESRVDLILNKLEPESNRSVPDPWFANTPAAFEEVFQMLDKACDKIVEEIKTELAI